MTSHFTHTASLRDRNYLSYFRGEETEAQRSQVTYPRPHSQYVREPGFKSLFGTISACTPTDPTWTVEDARQVVETARLGLVRAL